MADVVQGCQPGQYLDRTGPEADRELTWDFSIANDPERCLQIQSGQSVFWNGVSDLHPLGASGGDQPNPIIFHDNGHVTFNAPGTFGFQCLNHSSMKGAINVIAAAPSPATAAPAASLTLTLALTLVLLASGLFSIARRVGWRSKLLQARR